jgi:hypothetical protein
MYHETMLQLIGMTLGFGIGEECVISCVAEYVAHCGGGADFSGFWKRLTVITTVHS